MANCDMLHAGYMRDLSFVEVYFRRLSWNLSNLHWNLHFQLFQVHFADESQYQVSGIVHVRHVHVQLIENHRLQLIEKKATLYSVKFLYYVIFTLSFLGDIFSHFMQLSFVVSYIKVIEHGTIFIHLYF